ncbi:MAG: hypothetical protein M1826_003392 [Phylliscum demangeonii]|nr:MAG: hypothetical protein M1826_003392 [Phylliscum demangeonii]
MPDKNPRPPVVRLSLPLDYQQELFEELQAEDELVILARGLGLLRIVTNLLHAYDAAGDNLIVIVGADEREVSWVGEALVEHAAVSMSSKARGLTVVKTDVVNVGTREKMYANGGIFSITARILIVDLLSNLLKAETITGVVVLHGEKVVATSLEAFILRIYRQRNKAGFLKVFSDNPEPFMAGFSPLATMLRNLFLRKASLWPRFHVSVARSLEGRRKAEVIELEIPMTDSMHEIQTAVLECVEVSIGELKKANSGLEMDDWNVDSALHKSFDVIVRRQLDPVWHRVSWRSKQIVNDLAVLRQILHSLLTYDAVSFHRYLDTIRAAHSPPPGATRQSESPWLFLDAAHTIFDTAKRRVYTGKPDEKAPPGVIRSIPGSLRPVLEEQPKWALVTEVLDEIQRDSQLNPPPRDDSNSTILIVCSDQATCRQLREYIQTMLVQPESLPDDDDERPDGEGDAKPSAAFMMRRKLRDYLNWKRDFAKVSASLYAENQKALSGAVDSAYPKHGYRGKAPPNKRRRVRGGAATASSSSRTVEGALLMADDKEAQVSGLLAEINPTESEAQQKPEVITDPLDDLEDLFALFEMNDLIVVHPYDGDMDEHILEEIKPRTIIMYEPDAAFIRRVEVYRSSHADRTVRVYFMYYGGSVEEQRYLSAVRKEKDAFTRLIREKANMAVTLTHAGQGVDDPQEQFLRTVNTRIAGGGRLAATAEAPRVVVDVREFRSSLPSLLHGQNIEVVPCMLTVGDYVLTPEICIERKSVRDLISSFKNGRLYNQAEMMLHHYKSPMLLIEFDQTKSFTLELFADLTHSHQSSSSTQASDLQSKLVLLALAFPTLRIIWSSSPYQTATIFAELKKMSPEPDPIRAVQIGLPDDDGDGAGAAGHHPGGTRAPTATVNPVPQDMLRAVPGVTDKVARALVLEVGSVWELAQMEEQAIAELVGKEAGRQIWRFFNRSLFD